MIGVQGALSKPTGHEKAVARWMPPEMPTRTLTAAPAPSRQFGPWELEDALLMLSDGYHIETVIRRTGVSFSLLQPHVAGDGRGTWGQ